MSIRKDIEKLQEQLETTDENAMELYGRLDNVIDNLEAIDDDKERSEIYEMIENAVTILKSVKNEIY
ncbi:hypothetical protein ACYSNW_04665 [Enterococcus sp. LJL99]